MHREQKTWGFNGVGYGVQPLMEEAVSDSRNPSLTINTPLKSMIYGLERGEVDKEVTPVSRLTPLE